MDEIWKIYEDQGETKEFVNDLIVIVVAPCVFVDFYVEKEFEESKGLLLVILSSESVVGKWT
jgi:hypothetical protein